MLATWGANQGFSPSSLFSAGEQGTWYDPSDLTTLFQDAGGTTPVTAVEQPVGLMLDKSKNGVGTNGTKRVNLLTYTEQFDDAVWEKINISSSNPVVTANQGTAPDGTNTAYKISYPAVTGGNQVSLVRESITSAAISYKVSVYLKAFSDTDVGKKIYIYINDGALKGLTSITLTSSWQQLSTTATLSAATSYLSIGVLGSDYGGNSQNAVNAYIWGADLRLASEANTLPTYQKITDTWYNTLPGNHAYQTTSANRPTLSARYNLLTKTEQFDDAAWTKFNATITANSSIAPDETNTADAIYETANNSQHEIFQTITNDNVTTRFSAYVKPINSQYCGLQINNATNAGAGVVFDLSSATIVGYTAVGSGWSASNAKITNINNGWYLLSVDIASTGSTKKCSIELRGSNSTAWAPAYAGDTTKGVYIWGADLRVANDGVGIPAYQRVNTATNYDTVGFPTYLRFNGSSSAMMTNTITPGTDKAQVFAGVRKLSDATAGVISELSADRNANNGAWTFSNASAIYSFSSKGTSSESATSTSVYAAPLSNVITGLGNISGDSTILRINGTQAASSTADQGTGNYLAYPLYIGARAGTSLWLNGRIYSMIVRFGSNLTTAQITNTENYVNSKTKAY